MILLGPTNMVIISKIDCQKLVINIMEYLIINVRNNIKYVFYFQTKRMILFPNIHGYRQSCHYESNYILGIYTYTNIN